MIDDEKIIKAQSYAVALKDTSAWNGLVEFLKEESSEYEEALQGLNPFDDAFNNQFYLFQREIWARLRVVEIVDSLVEAHKINAEETLLDG